MIINKYLNYSGAWISSESYLAMYRRSLQEPEAFWKEQAQKYITWDKTPSAAISGDFSQHNVQWFSDGTLNASVNCIDRHLPQRANQPAILWEGDDASQSKVITYRELYEDVCRFANALKRLGVVKGDRVCLYLPMIPEAAVVMLACARIGAIHSVVFAGFSPESLKNRIQDAKCKIIVTADFSMRGGKKFLLQENVDQIIHDCPSVQNVIVIQRSEYFSQKNENLNFHDLISSESTDCPAEKMLATDPLFILYTSGSTGTPKGVVHGQGGYLLHVTMSFQLVFNYQEGDIFWCTADIGWITGHSYLIYGPLASGATTLMFEGIPTYPTASRYWEIIDKYHVNIFYTAPTVIRALMRKGDAALSHTSRESLKLVGTVGEPINAEAWLWYYTVVGKERCPVVDTWWQTETGGIMITNLPGATPLKPGFAGLPFFGVALGIMDAAGNLLEQEATGNLVVTRPWPGQLQTIYDNSERFEKSYFSHYAGMYFTGDGAQRDQDGYYAITGRTDDVINVSGHRLDTAEIERALTTHTHVAEAAVVGFPHEIKGQGIYAFVTPKVGITPDNAFKEALISLVRQQISPIAAPDHIEWTEDLPKTRSGKIMRRILRKIVSGEQDNLGDISTLANPESISKIILK